MKPKREYYLKENPKTFFRPRRFIRFFDTLKEHQQPYFKIAINTGGRVNEIRNLKVQDIDFEHNALTFYITKVKSKKKERRPMPRSFRISTEFAAWLQRYIHRHNLKPSDTFDIPTTQTIDEMIKTKLRRLQVKNWKDYSSHNVRKTHGTWLLACGKDSSEICLRLGHDLKTFQKHYASPDLFSYEEKVLIHSILGDLLPPVDSREELNALRERQIEV